MISGFRHCGARLRRALINGIRAPRGQAAWWPSAASERFLVMIIARRRQAPPGRFQPKKRLSPRHWTPRRWSLGLETRTPHTIVHWPPPASRRWSPGLATAKVSKLAFHRREALPLPTSLVCNPPFSFNPAPEVRRILVVPWTATGRLARGAACGS